MGANNEQPGKGGEGGPCGIRHADPCPLTPDELGASATGGAVASGPSAVPPFE